MALLENRYRDHGQIFTKFFFVVPNLFRRFSATIFFLLSLHLIYLSSNTPIHSGALEYLSLPIDNVMRFYRGIGNQIADMSGFISDLSRVQKENIALRLELNRLKEIEAQALMLRAENERLQKALELKSSAKYQTISARLLSIATGPYNRSAIIDGGSNQGIAVDQIVTSNNAVLGRIVEVSSNHSKMRLITDFTSRIPIVTEKSRIKGVVSGGNNNHPELNYVVDTSNLELGEDLVTSGDGKYFPAGLKVGKVTQISDDHIFTSPAIDPSKIDFIEIIKQ